LAVLGNAKMTSYAFLKRQFAAREARASIDKFKYPEIVLTYRDKIGKKLKMTASNGKDKHLYMKDLVLRMMKADARREHSMDGPQNLTGCRIAYWSSTTKRYASWEGTMEPVHLHPDGTVYRLDDDVIHLSNGKTMTKADKLIGYTLAEYIDGDDSEPTRSDCVDRYAFHALEKHEAFTARSSAPISTTTSTKS
jgi:hypothetical protein